MMTPVLALLASYCQKHSVTVLLLLRRLSLLLASILLLLFIWGGHRPEAAGLFKAPWDKLAHLSWFAVLAGLLDFGLNLRIRWPVALFCAGVALWDEGRQLTLPGRSADAGDLIFDGLGILIGILIARRIGKKLLPHP
ncbi:VanZ family protein [Methylomicrobium album]|uniref:Putative integral membrane protein n=1 Tax=Methylomicrobium album BG8 TaxID=686340 RepID=H8GNU4_METAL|nr:VanZ family protein [Methylomicrobium album]EIC30850.1 putative integral membrane protein [Methylomicrobium album BG8]